jgi:hypothetical protein
MTEARRAAGELGALGGLENRTTRGVSRWVARGIAQLTAPHTWRLFAAAILLYNSAGHLILWNIGGGDYWEHLATFHAFARNPLHPDNPYVARAEPTHLFTPYHLFWGVVARLLRMHPLDVLPLAGAANTLVFLAACKVLSRRLLGGTRWALPLALTLLIFWWKPWTWSGFYNLGFLPIASIYPFWFALPLAWITASVYPVEPQAAIPRRARALLAAPVVALVFLIHPLSGVFLIVALLALVLGTRKLSPGVRLALLLPPLAGIGLALLWPYFPVLETVRASGQFPDRGFAGDFHLFYDRFYLRLLPAWLGLPIILRALGQRRWDAIAGGFLLFVALYAVNYFTVRSSTLARGIIFVAFFLHLAVVQGLQRGEGSPRARLHARLFLVFLVLFGAIEGYDSAKRLGPIHDLRAGARLGEHSNRRYCQALLACGRFVRPADVVMAPLAESWLLPGTVGCKVVGVKHSNPFLADYAERMADTERFFAAESRPADRKALIAKYGVRFVLVPASATWRPREAGDGLRLAAEDRAFALYAVTAAGDRGEESLTPEHAPNPPLAAPSGSRP